MSIDYIVNNVAITDAETGRQCTPFETICVLPGTNESAVLQFNLSTPPFSMDVLNKIADIIEFRRQNRMKTIIHCGAGVERSPLVVAWWLYRIHGFDLDTAYKIIRVSRPMILDRREWISTGISY